MDSQTGSIAGDPKAYIKVVLDIVIFVIHPRLFQNLVTIFDLTASIIFLVSLGLQTFLLKTIPRIKRLLEGEQE